MARRRGITCPPPLRTGSPARKNSVMVCGGFIGGAGPQEPLPLEDQTFVEITKCCDDTTGDGVGDTTFFKLLIVDGTGATESSSTVDGAGLPYTPVSEVPCGIQTDLETIEACYQDVTDPTIRYTRLTLVDVTNQEVDGVIWLDDSGMSIAEPDAATIEPCVSAEYTDIQTRCKCDDINEDGSEYVDYVEAFKIDCTGGVVTSTLIGTFTDSTMSEAYTPVSPIDCNDVGDDACLREFVMCDEGTSFVRVVDILSGTKIIDYTGEFEAYTVVGTPTLGACAVKQKVTPIVHGVRIDINKVDNHSVGEPRPIGPGIVAWPQDDHTIKFGMSDGSFCEAAWPAFDPSFIDPDTGNPYTSRWKYTNAALAAAAASCTGKDWAFAVSGPDGDASTPWGGHASVECCPGDKYIVSAVATVTSKARNGRVIPLLTSYTKGTPTKYYEYPCPGQPSVWTLSDGTILPEAPDLTCAAINCAFEEAATCCPVATDCNLQTFGPLSDCDLSIDPPGTFATDIYVDVETCEGAQTVVTYTLDADGRPDEYIVQGTLADPVTKELFVEPPLEICGVPTGIVKCYGVDGGSVNYDNADNSTDIDISMNEDTIKWNTTTSAPNDGAPAMALAINDCINSGETAYLTMTDYDGNVCTFEATGLLGAGNADGTGQWNFTGTRTSEGSAKKLNAASLVCGSGAGKAYKLWDCVSQTSEWRDCLTDAIVDASLIVDCPVEEAVDPFAPFKTVCPDPSIIPDANYDGAMPITTGRPANNVPWQLVDNRDLDNQIVVAEGATFQEFSASLAAAGYTEFIEGEIHYICPCPPGYDGPSAPDGQYFTSADGQTVTKGGCTALTELAFAPEKADSGEEKCALQILGCLDQQILDELKALNARPLGLIESCDGTQLWTVNSDGTYNGPFVNPSALAAKTETKESTEKEAVKKGV